MLIDKQPQITSITNMCLTPLFSYGCQHGIKIEFSIVYSKSCCCLGIKNQSRDLLMLSDWLITFIHAGNLVRLTSSMIETKFTITLGLKSVNILSITYRCENNRAGGKIFFSFRVFSSIRTLSSEANSCKRGNSEHEGQFRNRQ